MQPLISAFVAGFCIMGGISALIMGSPVGAIVQFFLGALNGAVAIGLHKDCR